MSISSKQLLDLVKSLNFYVPLKHRKSTKIAAILGHERISKIKGLVTTVTSLREPNNPYFAQFTCYVWKVRSILVANMLHRCVVGGCSNVRSLENEIALHTILFHGDERPEVKKRRKRWIDFARLKRAQWEPPKSSVICSKHFKPDDFVRNYMLLKDQEALSIPYLERDSFRINTFATVHTEVHVAEDEQPLSNRGERMVRYFTSTKSLSCRFRNDMFIIPCLVKP